MIDLFMDIFLNSFELHLEQLTPYSLAESLLEADLMDQLDSIEASEFTTIS